MKKISDFTYECDLLEIGTPSYINSTIIFTLNVVEKALEMLNERSSILGELHNGCNEQPSYVNFKNASHYLENIHINEDKTKLVGTVRLVNLGKTIEDKIDLMYMRPRLFIGEFTRVEYDGETKVVPNFINIVTWDIAMKSDTEKDNFNV